MQHQLQGHPNHDRLCPYCRFPTGCDWFLLLLWPIRWAIGLLFIHLNCRRRMVMRRIRQSLCEYEAAQLAEDGGTTEPFLACLGGIGQSDGASRCPCEPRGLGSAQQSEKESEDGGTMPNASGKLSKRVLNEVGQVDSVLGSPKPSSTGSTGSPAQPGAATDSRTSPSLSSIRGPVFSPASVHRGNMLVPQTGVQRKPGSLCVVSYDVHSGVNALGQFAPVEVSAVLNEIDADVIGMQDVFVATSSRGEGTGFDLLQFTSERTGLGYRQFLGDASPRKDEAGRLAIDCGVGVLSKYPLSTVRTFDFTKWAGRPQRRALACIVEHPDLRMWVVTLHMQNDVTSLEQLSQARELLGFIESLQDLEDLDTVVCGGFNTVPCSLAVSCLNRTMDNLWLYGVGQGTYPSYWPVLLVDYIFMYHGRELNCETMTVKSSMASMHLPVLAYFSYSIGVFQG